MAELQQLNLPALFLAADRIKRSRLEADLLAKNAQRQEQVQGLTGQAVRGDIPSTVELGGLDPKTATEAREFFIESILPAVLNEARGVKDPQTYSAFRDKLTQAKLIDPDDPPPPEHDPAFVERFIAEGEALTAEPQKQFAPPELLRLQRARDAAVEAGNETAAAEIQRRIDKLGEPQPGKTEFDLPTVNRQDEIRGNVQAVSRARSNLAKVRQSIIDKRSRAGLVGSIARGAQEAVGIVRDFADIGIDVAGLIGDTIPEVANDINAGKADEGIAGFFDPSIPRNDVFENAIAYGLARARKGSGRLNVQDFQNAKKDLKLTGLTSSDAVLARLQAVDEELGAAQNDFQNRLSSDGKTSIPTYEVRDGKLIQVE